MVVVYRPFFFLPSITQLPNKALRDGIKFNSKQPAEEPDPLSLSLSV